MSLLGALWCPKLRLLNGSYQSIFRLHHHAHGLKVGLQLFKSSLVFKLELLENFIELTLRCADLLRNPIGTVLQVTTDVTHRLSPRLEFLSPRTTAQRNSSGHSPDKKCDRAHGIAAAPLAACRP
jgi:hypothetical protein